MAGHFFTLYFTNHFGGNSTDHRIFRYILGYHCSGSNHRTVSNCYTLRDHNVRTDPNTISNVYPLINIVAVIGIQIMINGCQNNVMANQHMVPDEYSTLILKMA